MRSASRNLPRRLSALLLSSAMLTVMLTILPTAKAAALPAGFSESTVFNGLSNPTVVKFSPDGRVFVTEKNGRLKEFDSLTDTTATTVADLSTQVYNFWDRGLLGMALHPNFPATPYIYLLYTADAVIGGEAPKWGTPGTLSDPCPTPPGPTDGGCVASTRLSRLEVSPTNTVVGSETVLIDDWCQQYPSHSAGSLSFGADGMLYATGGDGASFNFADYGQGGTPQNPCGDPGGPNPTPPTAEGGSLRAQDYRTPDDPYTLSGSVIRVDPMTGEGVPGNPMFSSPDANARRIIASGFRNPFRIVHKPATNEMYIGDVGWNVFEEINRIPDATDGTMRNFGWPCYEGPNRQPSFDSLNVDICEKLYAEGPTAVVPPVFSYKHTDPVTPNDGCAPGGSSLAGVAFEFNTGGAYPPAYNGALFFADYSRKCIWAMMPGPNGTPDPTHIQPFVTPASGGPVNLEFGPSGELFYVGYDTGEIRRVDYSATPPTCAAGQFAAEYFNGVTPSTTPAVRRCETTINNDWGLGSPAPGINSDMFSARWTGNQTFAAGSYDFTSTSDDGIRVYIDGALLIDNWTNHAVTVNKASTILTTGPHEVKVEYYDNLHGAVAKLSWAQSDVSPVPTMSTPAVGTTWKVNDTLSFSGSATDPQEGTLPASALTWDLLLQHCPSNCHTHQIQSWVGVSSGSFVAPDHEYPSYLELRLTATDADGHASTVVRRLDPKTVTLTFQSNPAGRQLAVGGTGAPAPFTRTVIIGSNNLISATTPQTSGTTTFNFANWSDGGAQSHTIIAPATAATYKATYTAQTPTYTRFARVNFQPAGTPLFTGYISDTGATYAARNSLTYGWNVDIRGATRDRNNSASADQRYDTFIHPQLLANGRWEMAVPNGTYRVKMVCGDPNKFDSTYRLDVESVRACNAVPTTSTRWITATVVVAVTDGKLTMTNGSGGVNNKVNFLDIDKVS